MKIAPLILAFTIASPLLKATPSDNRVALHGNAYKRLLKALAGSTPLYSLLEYRKAYAALGFQDDEYPSLEEVKSRRRALAQACHPDKYKGSDAHEIMTNINAAYDIIEWEQELTSKIMKIIPLVLIGIPAAIFCLKKAVARVRKRG